MKANILIILLISSFSLIAQTPTLSPVTNTPATPQKAVSPTAPKISFDVETHDFGEIDEGPKVTYEFHFENTGLEPLILSNVRASCGCTVPTWPKEPILPGQKSMISVTYNTERRIGTFNKPITITSNAATSPKMIYIKGKVNKVPDQQTMPVKTPSMLSPN